MKWKPTLTLRIFCLKTNNSDISLDVLGFDSPLSRILLAAGSKGLCLLHFCGSAPSSDTEVRLFMTSLCPEFEKHFRAGAQALFLRDVQGAVFRYLQEGVPLPPIRSDLSKGTLFQQKVWKALCEIPFGEIQSYQQVAQRIGHPRGARAVGQACAQNPLALVVPCHRVLAGNGKLGGYSGGLHIKKALLDLERQSIGRSGNKGDRKES